MKCHECGHENTEGAWLCINCGVKLQREDDQGDELSDSVEEPSRFEPTISESLRRLRERNAGQQATSGTRRQRPSGARPSGSGMPNLTGGSQVLGLPVTVWAIAIVVVLIAAMVLGSLQ